jgi:predicted permease
MRYVSDSLLLDCRQALRATRRRPAFALAATAVLAAGIGTAAAVFAVVNAAFLRPLPYPRPEQLVWLDTREPSPGGEPVTMALSALHFSRWREEQRAFAGVEAIGPRTISLAGSGEPEPLRGAAVSAGIFKVLGVSPILGRDFTREEERAGSGVAIVSHGLWQRKFGGDPSIIGRSVLLDEEPRVIVGVMPRSFAPAMQPGDVWIPLALGPDELVPRQAGLRTLNAIGRLRPGVSVRQATDASNLIIQQLAREVPDVHRFTRAAVTPLREQLYGAHRGSLVLIFAAVVLLFVLACVNLASVTMSKALARAPETAMRRALGASVARLVRIRLIESLLITAVGALAGVGVTSAVLAWLRSEFPTIVATYGDLGVDPAVVTVATALAVVAAAAIGLAASVPDVRAATGGLRLSGARVAGGRVEHRLRATLLGAQVALTLVLLSGAGLLLRGFQRLMREGTGISSERVLTFQFHPSRRTYTTAPQRAAYVGRLLDELSTLPGVVSAGSTQASFGAAESMQSGIEIEGQAVTTGERLAANIRHVTPGYFTALRVPMRAGRSFTNADREGTPLVAVVSESFARHFWPGQNAIGKRLRRAGRSAASWMEVVGVAADVRDAGLSTAPVPTFYVAYLQQNTPTARVTVLIRTPSDPALLAPGVRRVVRSIDPNQVMDFVFPLDELLTRSVAIERLRSALLTMFAAGGLTVALVGLYGLATFGVARRTREIGIRAALGARRRQILALVLGDALGPVAVGVGVGVALAAGLAGYVQRAFPDVASIDPVVFAAAAAGLLLAAGAAAVVPSARALRIDPAITLREEQ